MKQRTATMSTLRFMCKPSLKNAPYRYMIRNFSQYKIPMVAMSEIVEVEELNLTALDVTGVYLESYDAELAAIGRGIDEVHQMIPRSIALWGYKNQTAQYVETRVTQLWRQVDGIQKDLRKFCDSVQETSQINFDVLLGDIGGLKRELNKERIDRKGVQQRLDEHLGKIKKLEQEMNVMRGLLAETEQRLKDVMFEKDILQQAFDTTQNKLEDTQGNAERLESETEALRNAKETLEQEQQEMRKKYKRRMRLNTFVTFSIATCVAFVLYQSEKLEWDEYLQKIATEYNRTITAKDDEIVALQQQLEPKKKSNESGFFAWLFGY